MFHSAACRALLRQYMKTIAATPLTRMLLVSLSLHLALIVVIQPKPGSTIPYTHVINARLVNQAKVAEVTTVPDEAVPEDIPRTLDNLESSTGETTVNTVVVPPSPEAAAKPEPVAGAGANAGLESESHLPPKAESVLPSVPVMIDPTWYSARQLDSQPKARQRIEPAYPDQARRDGIEGNVILILKVDEFGAVKEASVESGNPPGMFDASALQAFKEASFTPAKLSGRPVRAEIRIRVNYSLKD
jgi:periplasmic protein TonB